ncbi:CHAT domain-containing protein [Desulfonema magnum]|uniref:Tetratricopeptide repeat-containing protein n=1 Tax=Desulfonema magnum TaxID=45655 RepID=A0A975GL82_9BACT|nr:CHAT domain-containing protein [Desulfonema magnum]QTA84553.1 Tetratricopeptide repeat-containing protein [Desulfonema magnum]
MRPKPFIRRIRLLVFSLILGILWLAPGLAASEKTVPKRLSVNLPEQITSETDPVLHTAISDDGKWMVFTCVREGFSDLWLRSVDPSVVILPKQLTRDPSKESSPAFSPDGQFIAYVGTAYDVKGDIYLLDISSVFTASDSGQEKIKSVRLTGRETEDGSPCFSPDGNALYFHQIKSGEMQRKVVMLNLSEKSRPPRALDMKGDAAFPSVSPDGTQIIFVSYRHDPAGDIFLSDMKSGTVRPLTSGPYMDFLPAWSKDGTRVFFSRFGTDTDKDGAITTKDNASVYKVSLLTPHASRLASSPVTSASYSAFQPQTAGSKLFFLSDRGGVNNCWALPIEGQIPLLKKAEEQIRLAQEISLRIPFDPYLTLLGYYKVLEKFSDKTSFAALAAYKIGKIYQKMNLPKAADSAFQIITCGGVSAPCAYRDIQPWAAFSLMEQRVMRTQAELRHVANKSLRLELINECSDKLRRIAAEQDLLIQNRAEIESARLLADEGKNSDALLKALGLLDAVIRNYSARSLSLSEKLGFSLLQSEREHVAEAMILKADIYSRLGSPEKIYPICLSVISTYPDVTVWADEAVNRILNISVSETGEADIISQVKLLRKIAEENQETNPLLSAGALNRVGDLFFASDEWHKAKAAYYQVLEQFSKPTTQTAAARLSLAEILYREERFRQALDLYETELGLRAYEDNIYHLARAGYIRKSIAAGEYLYRLGEIPSARKNFKQLIAYDDAIIEAHRGYIKCAAASRDIHDVLNSYRKKLQQHPNDPVALYASALCLTYLEDKSSLEEAKKLLTQAIYYNGQTEYFHQTLGYVSEVFETVYGEKGNLEMALESYKKAYFLNDHKNNPDNAANLLLNLGNIYYLLGQYHKAFQYYSLRVDTKKPFDNTNTEILFYRRLGASAFQEKATEKTIAAFTKALDLINSHIEPQQASGAFDKINRYVMDRIVSPALTQDDLSEKAKAIAKRQSQINLGLARLTWKPFPPPAREWISYKKGIEGLLSEQEALNREIISLQKDVKDADINPEYLRETLSNFLLKVRESLEFPERLIELRAEMLDRLGLAYQEGEDWENAMKTFHAVFLLNEKLRFYQNLPKNKRSEAYNTYMLAGTLSGEERQRLLHEAAEDFSQVIGLVKKYGVPEKKEDNGKGLIDINVRISLNDAGSTAAGKGFSSDQEIRLAEAFISRISIERGELIPAEEAIQKQLAQYPPDKPVSDKDAYGVSLLYHRAAHLAYTRKKFSDAYKYFHRSAELSLRLRNPVSTAINVTNMAKLETGDLKLETGNWKLDRETSQLLAKNPLAGGKPVAAIYHNKMGVYAMACGMRDSEYETDGSELEKTVSELRALQNAVSHFTRGIQLLEKEKTRDRETLSLVSTLHLNMARAALILGEREKAGKYFETALELSERAMLPDLKWRALAGLGRLSESLDVLESVTILSAGCGPREITMTFGPLVLDLVRENKTEEAFNLAEHLSELERFNRMAALIGKIPGKEKAVYRHNYERLERIYKLRKKIAGAEGEEKVFSEESLDRELELLRLKMGEDRAKLSDIVRLLPEGETQEMIMMLLGIAVHAEEAADRSDLKGPSIEFRRLAEQYRQLREEAIFGKPEEKFANMILFFGPESFEAIDIMEHLPENGTLIRVFRTGERFVIFTLFPDEIKASITDTLENISVPQDGPAYLAYENPLAVPGHEIYALSATHLFRSFMNRKPFKHALLAVPSLDNPLPQYDIQTLPDAENIQVSNIHTLLLSNSVSLTSSVPTRAGEYPERFFAVEIDKGRRFRIEHLLMNSFSDLSLAVLLGANFDEAYLMGHLFSVYGCPSVILPVQPVTDPDFSREFLKAYTTRSAAESMGIATSRFPLVTPQWILLGYQGMSAEESAAFGREHFEKYVRDGRKAFENNSPGEALSLFENAIIIAKETESFHRYLSLLYLYARESAYKVGEIEKSLNYSQLLTERMVQEKPDTEDHAEALLKTGLLHAKLEQHEKAIPLLEEAVEILANLESEMKQASALAELGVVLENATEYDRAIVRFQSAASLSDTLSKDELLAAQYVNIGRIYDLRLSQYVLGMQNYEKALSIYQDMEETGGAAQCLLHIGRCYRLLGNFPDADKQYLEALKRIESEPENSRLRAKIIIEQANNAWYQSRYEDAFKLQRTAYRISRENGFPLLEVMTLNTSGLTWWTLGDNQKALDELGKALSVAKTLKARDDEIAATLNNIGLVYREMGRYEDALKTLDDALDIDTRLRSRWAIAYDLRNIALTLLKMGEADKAVPLFAEAASEAHAIGNRINEAKSLLGLGEAYFVLGNNDNAEEAYEKALALSKSMVIRETEWRSLYGLAKIPLSRLGTSEVSKSSELSYRREAEKLLLEATAVIEGIRSDIKIDQLKDSFIANKLAVYEDLVRLLADMGRPVESFEIAERSRARNFLDLLGNQHLSLSRDTDQTLYNRQQVIKARIREYETLAAQSSDDAERSIYTHALQGFRNDLENIMLEIQAENPQLASLVSVRPINAEKLLSLLEPDVGLLAYYVLPDEIFCWLVRSDSIRLFRTPVGRESLGQAILDYRRMIQNLEPLEDQSEELFKWLLTPVISGLDGVRMLGIIPHGALHYLSYATLSDQRNFLIDRFPLFYLPGASVLEYTLSKRRDDKNLKVLAIGNPDVGDAAFDLPFAEHEVESVKWNFPDITILTKEKATESWVVRNIEKFGIIHVASHGEFEPINPLFSAIKLSKDMDADGDLEAAEVFGLKINADMVVLSACQTGLGKVTRGDDVIGLNRAFFYAGAHTLVSSLWRVSDISTAILIRQFYREYVTHNKADALTRAILHVKKRYPHPGYWGAFTLVGDHY